MPSSARGVFGVKGGVKQQCAFSCGVSPDSSGEESSGADADFESPVSATLLKEELRPTYGLRTGLPWTHWTDPAPQISCR